jgi:hypothetical protein
METCRRPPTSLAKALTLRRRSAGDIDQRWAPTASRVPDTRRRSRGRRSVRVPVPGPLSNPTHGSGQHKADGEHPSVTNTTVGRVVSPSGCSDGGQGFGGGPGDELLLGVAADLHQGDVGVGGFCE